MSVAFRRESDEEVLEPKFDQPIPPGPNLVTANGLAQIEARIGALDAVLSGALADAERAERERERRYWRVRLGSAQIAPMPPPGQVGFGSRVRFVLDGVERKVTIVGSDEADPATGMIGFNSPLARALMQARVGDTVDFQGRAEAIAVLEIDGAALAGTGARD